MLEFDFLQGPCRDIRSVRLADASRPATLREINVTEQGTP